MGAVLAGLGRRALLGLRSPINTVARLLNPMDAPASVDGVFHPPYIALHLKAVTMSSGLLTGSAHAASTSR